ncbi:GntR family transcriptional regulator [Tianweitania sediminis]|uniref:GntR family transcriptional regulator n=1 Tax=Tianweitania sediminis TaxID=1502156 RepID=A0A8J7RI95_9HYPH|nr:GntR family transcriptional regulator [Tianweitania sediminis]MBP0437706.1 GntR family transcriptional regulator [Tianweitania sediminis]
MASARGAAWSASKTDFDPGAEEFGDGLRNLARVNLVSEAYKELRRGLMTGRFPPGAKLNIRDLAAALNISPTPAREALVQLAAEGALTQIAGRSFRVAELTAEDYVELRDLRLNLEGVSAAEAAKKIDRDAILHLEQVHEQLVRSKAELDFKSALIWNQEFHLRVCAEARLPRLLRIVEGLWLQMGPLLNALYARREMPKSGADEAKHSHVLMLKAFRARDPEAARAAMQADIAGSSDEIIANLRKL